MNDIIATIEQLGFAYHGQGDDLVILDGADFSIKKGEIVALVGASGSGKSSFLHILGLMESHFTGHYQLMGHNIANIGENKRNILRGNHIGFVFQSHYLVGECTALDNVALSLIIKETPVKIARQQAGEWLERVGLAGRTHHYPHQLSGGERQRVAIARALIHQPQLLLADEPTGNLDPATASGIFQLILSLVHDNDIGALIVTHDHAKAAQCHRQLHIANKKLVPLG